MGIERVIVTVELGVEGVAIGLIAVLVELGIKRVADVLAELRESVSARRFDDNLAALADHSLPTGDFDQDELNVVMGVCSFLQRKIVVKPGKPFENNVSEH